MHGDDVDHNCQRKEDEERHMEVMPHSKEPFEERQPLRLFDRGTEDPKMTVDLLHFFSPLTARRTLPFRS